MNNSELRQYIGRERRQLGKQQRCHAGLKVALQLQRISQYRSAQHIACYLDAFGELATQPIIEQLFKRKKNLYLPAVERFPKELRWRTVSAQQYQQQRFYRHRLGMLQPHQNFSRPTRALDVIFMPLMAVDQYGHRLGMGGGFYDRTLAQCPHSPIRIGIGYDFQFVERIAKVEAWDQRLDYFISPSVCLKFKRMQ